MKQAPLLLLTLLLLASPASATTYAVHSFQSTGWAYGDAIYLNASESLPGSYNYCGCMSSGPYYTWHFAKWNFYDNCENLNAEDINVDVSTCITPPCDDCWFKVVDTESYQEGQQVNYCYIIEVCLIGE